MFRLWSTVGLFAGVLCLLCGFSSNGRAASALPVGHVDLSTAATIRGFVRFRGPRPSLPVIDFSSNPQCEREHPKPVRAETVIVNPNGTLRDTFVWISSGLGNVRWNPPATPVRLEQTGCIYRPHVLAFMVNQELLIANGDPVNHDVHIESAVNPASNESEPPRSETLRKRYSSQEIWFPVTCGIHPWMRSYLAVVAHPFFAVTGANGSFSLKGVPPGTYTIEAIQEKFGRQHQRVIVGPKEIKSVDFHYAG